MCNMVEGLRREKVDEPTLIALETDLAKITIPEKEKVFLLLAEAMTLHPSESNRYVDRSRELGWKESEIAQMVYVIGLFNMVTRVAEAFALEPDATHPYDPAKPFPLLSCKKQN